MRSGYDCGGHWCGFGIWFEILEVRVIMVWPWIWGLGCWVDLVVVQEPMIIVVPVSFGLAVGLGFGALD